MIQMNVLRGLPSTVILCLLLDLVGFPAVASDTAGNPVSLETVQSRLKALENASGVSAETKTLLKNIYQETIQEIESAKRFSEQAARFERQAADAPSEATKTRAEIARLSTVEPAAPSGRDMISVRMALSQKASELDRLRQELAERDADLKNHANRRAELVRLRTVAVERLAALDGAPNALESSDSNDVREATRWLAAAKRQSLESEKIAYGRENAAIEVTVELIPLRRDLAAARVSLAERELHLLGDATIERRKQEVEQQGAAVIEAARNLGEEKNPIALENAELVRERRELAEKAIADGIRLFQLRATLGSTRDQFAQIKKKAERSENSKGLGVLFRKQRDALPRASVYKAQLKRDQAAIEDVQTALFALEDQRNALTARLRETRTKDKSDKDRQLLEIQKDCLIALVADNSVYLDWLVDMDQGEQTLIALLGDYARFLDERILWLRSTVMLGKGDFVDAAAAFQWMFGREGLGEPANALARDAARNPLPWVGLFGLLGLVWYRRRMQNKKPITPIVKKKRSADYLGVSLSAIGRAALSATVAPLVIWVVAWRLDVAQEASAWCKAISDGLEELAVAWFLLAILRQLVAAGGIAVKHFGWTEPRAIGISRLLTRLSPVFLAAWFFKATMTSLDRPEWYDSVGRISLIVSMLSLGAFLLGMRKVLGATAPPNAAKSALLRAVGWVMIGVPVVLAVLATIGYQYTADQLDERYCLTLAVFAAIAVARRLLLRGAALQGERVPANCDIRSGAYETQTRRFISYSTALAGCLTLSLLWFDVLPALGVFRKVDLWQTTTATQLTVPAADGTETVKTIERPATVTLADLLLAAGAIAVCWMAIRNMPGLCATVLRHRRFDAGLRYAIVTLSRYLVAAIGLVTAGNLLGFGWSKTQWLVAGLSVGLGLGLQQIFADLFSGLIILFERPVRIGDVVTIEGQTGVVTRIQLRATTIRTWDRKELVVPNRDFVSNRLTNWTLSDPVNQISIRVRVSYGADIDATKSLLLETANRHPRVLADPPASVTLEEFADKALVFVLRCNLPTVEERFEVVHELNTAIYQVLSTEGIAAWCPINDEAATAGPNSSRILLTRIEPSDVDPSRKAA